jgi:colicin import membrane protein
MHAEALHRPASHPDGGLGRDFALALGVHLGIVLLFFLGSIFSWQRELPAAAGASMDASLELSASETRAAERALRAAETIEPLPAPVEELMEEETMPPPQPVPAPVPQDSPVPLQQVAQERVPVPDTTDQDRADALALSRERELREQEQKRRQEQIDLTERQRQEQAEKRRRLAEQQAEADKQKQLDEIRRQRAQLEQQKKLQEQKLRQLAEARARQAESAAPTQAPSASAPAGSSGVDPGLLEAYKSAIQQAVASQWTKPDSVQPGTRCKVVIRQLPGGSVTSAEVQPGCAMDQIAQDYLERAVLKADPLPYRGFEDVFNRTLIFNFEAR